MILILVRYRETKQVVLMLIRHGERKSTGGTSVAKTWKNAAKTWRKKAEYSRYL